MRHFSLWDLLPLWQEIVLILMAAAGGVWTWFKFREAASWPSTQGTISSTSTRHSGGHRRSWDGELTYTYIVEGQYYSGCHAVKALSQSRAQEKIADWKGRMVVVRYHPSQHEVSTLLRSDQVGGQLGN